MTGAPSNGNAPHSMHIAEPSDKPLGFSDVAEHLMRQQTRLMDGERAREKKAKALVVKARKYYECRQTGEVSSVSNQFVETDISNKPILINPIISYHVDANAAMMVRSKPTIRAVARSEERIEKREAARYATRVFESYDAHWYSSSLAEREVKQSLLLSGEAYRLTYPAQVGYVETEGMKDYDLPAREAAWVCPKCGAGGAGEVEQCPKCGYLGVRVERSFGLQGSVRGGREQVAAIDMRTDLVDMIEVTYDSHSADIYESAWIIRNRQVMTALLRSAFGHMDFGKGAAPEWLEWKRDLETRGTRHGQGEAKGDYDLVSFTEMWQEPRLYAGRDFKEDMTLPDGRQVLRGNLLTEVFKRGIYTGSVSGKLMFLREESKSDCWSGCVYSTSSGAHGITPIFALVMLQHQLNRLYSLKYRNAMVNSTSPLLHDVRVNNLKSLPSDPNALVAISVPIDQMAGIGSLFGRLPPVAPLRDVDTLIEWIESSMQIISGASALNAPTTDIEELGTATGINAAQNQTSTRLGAPLAQLAGMRRNHAMQIIKGRHKYWREEQYEQLDREMGKQAGRWFRESNPEDDFIIEVADGSWIPRTEERQLQEVNLLMKVLDPNDAVGRKTVRNRVLEIIGDPGLDIDDSHASKIEAARRWQVIKDLSGKGLAQGSERIMPHETEMLGQITSQLLRAAAEELKFPPAALEESHGLPLDVTYDRHEHFEKFYADYLLSPEGIEASALLRTIAHSLAHSHKLAAVEQAAKNLADKLMSQKPMLDAQKIAHQGEPDPHAQALEMKKADVMGRMAQQAQKGDIEMEKKRADHAHEAAMAAAHHEPAQDEGGYDPFAEYGIAA